MQQLARAERPPPAPPEEPERAAAVKERFGKKRKISYIFRVVEVEAFVNGYFGRKPLFLERLHNEL